VMYFGQVIDLQQIEHDEKLPTTLDPALKEQRIQVNGPSEKRSFLVRILTPFAEGQTPEFQGICVGHVKDPKTSGETFISTIHAAKYRMMSLLKVGSEEGLTMALLAHPEVFEYLPNCKGAGEIEGITYGCSRGICTETGKKCSVCSGSGKNISTSVLKAKYFDLPDEAILDGQQLIDLSKLKHFSAPDVAIIQALVGYREKVEQACLHDIFTTASLESKPLETATRVAVDEDAQNSAVYPYSRKWATVKIKLKWLVAMFVDADKGLQVTCKVPSRLQLAPYEVILDRRSKVVRPCKKGCARSQAGRTPIGTEDGRSAGEVPPLGGTVGKPEVRVQGSADDRGKDTDRP
jgi:hypothetical protein